MTKCDFTSFNLNIECSREVIQLSKCTSDTSDYFLNELKIVPVPKTTKIKKEYICDEKSLILVRCGLGPDEICMDRSLLCSQHRSLFGLKWKAKYYQSCTSPFHENQSKNKRRASFPLVKEIYNDITRKKLDNSYKKITVGSLLCRPCISSINEKLKTIKAEQLMLTGNYK